MNNSDFHEEAKLDKNKAFSKVIITKKFIIFFKYFNNIFLKLIKIYNINYLFPKFLKIKISKIAINQS